MAEQILTFHSMHADHLNWQSDHQRWKNDIARWRHEYESEIHNLDRLKDLIQTHKEALDEHAQTLERDEIRHQDHERALDAYTHDGTEEQQQAVMADDHRKEAECHEQARDAHEELKQRQHARMAHLVMLRASINELA